jgi:hypothetical protein
MNENENWRFPNPANAKRMVGLGRPDRFLRASSTFVSGSSYQLEEIQKNLAKDVHERSGASIARARESSPFPAPIC